MICTLRSASKYRCIVYVLLAVAFGALCYLICAEKLNATPKFCDCIRSERSTDRTKVLVYSSQVNFLAGDARNSIDYGTQAQEPLEPPEDAVPESSLDGPLPAAFRRSLQMYTVVPTSNVTIVLVVAYYRSGSSFFGELVSSSPRTYFHFEPLQPFTVPGRIRPGRQRLAFALLDELVRCRMYNAPLITLWQENGPEYKHNRFLADVCGNGPSCSSPGHISALCSRAETQVFKFTRLSIAQVVAWINRNFDIANNVQVVHLVRDPRGIYASRQNTSWCSTDKECGSARALCEQIRQDLNAYENLKGDRWWSNRMHRIRFEDVATDPINEAQRLFPRLGLPYGPSVISFVKNHTVANEDDLKNPYSTRRNANAVVRSWAEKLSKETVRSIENVCGDILRRLGYSDFVDEARREKKE